MLTSQRATRRKGSRIELMVEDTMVLVNVLPWSIERDEDERLMV